MSRDFMAWSANRLQAEWSGITYWMMVVRAIQSAGTPVTKEPVSNQWVWPDWTAKGQTVLHRYHGKEANLWRGTSPWWAHWQLLICRLLLGLPASQQTSLPVVKRRNIRASPTRIFFSQSQWNPTVRSVPVLCPSLPLWANAWRAPPATCARRHFYSKDSRSLFNVLIPS